MFILNFNTLNLVLSQLTEDHILLSFVFGLNYLNLLLVVGSDGGGGSSRLSDSLAGVHLQSMWRMSSRESGR